MFVIACAATESPDDRGNVYEVFEYLDHDMCGLLDEPTVKLSDGQVKYYMKKLLEGLDYCFRCNVIHRDIKGLR